MAVPRGTVVNKAVASNVTAAGAVTTGGIDSATIVTVRVAVDALPAASVAVYVNVFTAPIVAVLTVPVVITVTVPSTISAAVAPASV